MVSVSGNKTNNKVTASPSTSTNNRAEVKPVNINNQVEATNNLAKYYSEISQDWAIGEGLIQNIDYSSKTYALQSKEYSNDAKESMEITESYMDNAMSNIQTAETNALNNIITQEESAISTVNQGVEQLNTTITDGLENINTSAYSGVGAIETLKNNSIDEITTNKESALNDITTAELNALNHIDEDFNNATSEINTNRTNTLAQISTLANESISDINAVGKSYDNLTHKNITNCLLEVPQRIKYELADGTLTIKAGSVVIVPYGTEDLTAQYPVGSTFLNDNFKVYDTQFEDGKFFVWAELVGDVIRNATSSSSVYERLMYINITNSVTVGTIENTSGSGDTSSTSASYNHYNTTTNLIVCKNEGAIKDVILSLPIFKYLSSTTYNVASISQVFNGIGYIGSTIWVDKGVKGLAPNYRNTDYTLNSVEWEIDKIKTFTDTSTNTNDMNFGYNVDAQVLQAMSPANWSFDDLANIYKHKTEGEQIITNLGSYTQTGNSSGSVSNFKSNKPFRITDNAVSKSGDTMNGPLVINTDKDSQLRNLILQFSSADFATPPSSNIYPNIELQDGQGRRMGRVEYTYKPNGGHYIGIIDKKNATTSSYASILVGYDENGNIISSAPACATTNSIVTTTGIKKASNGYLKLGNGIIIQWGDVTTPANIKYSTLTFPTAWTSTNYKIVTTHNGNLEQAEDGNTISFDTRTTTNCKCHRHTTYSSARSANWIAIGY